MARFMSMIPSLPKHFNPCSILSFPTLCWIQFSTSIHMYLLIMRKTCAHSSPTTWPCIHWITNTKLIMTKNATIVPATLLCPRCTRWGLQIILFSALAAGVILSIKSLWLFSRQPPAGDLVLMRQERILRWLVVFEKSFNGNLSKPISWDQPNLLFSLNFFWGSLC